MCGQRANSSPTTKSATVSAHTASQSSNAHKENKKAGHGQHRDDCTATNETNETTIARNDQ
jgi:hypothetical protein